MPRVGKVRSYGVDCGQVTTMLTAAKANGMKLFAGIFDLSQASSEIDTLISAVNGDWSDIWAVTMGNEDVNQGKASVGDVIAALNAGRSQLRGAGYNGPVVHVDTFNQILANPELCQNSDIATANAHAFFDPNTPAEKAGDFVLEQSQAMAKACGKEVWITESGWPHGGDPNGQAIPSPQNQQIALDSIRSKFSGNLFLFSAFDDDWKQDGPGTFGAEHFWGIVDGNLSGY
jgi:exo-beta-1,3-glucanase (GH17 family)